MEKRNRKEITIGELNSKLDGMIQQLGAIQELQLNLHKHMTDFTGWTAQWIEERRKEAIEEEKRHQIALNYQSLLLGLFIGIVGNLFVSYFYNNYISVFINSGIYIFTYFS
jgi:ABC-type siderophore export system fused ATPase/permease subunit